MAKRGRFPSLDDAASTNLLEHLASGLGLKTQVRNSKKGDIAYPLWRRGKRLPKLENCEARSVSGVGGADGGTVTRD